MLIDKSCRLHNPKVRRSRRKTDTHFLGGWTAGKQRVSCKWNSNHQKDRSGPE
jgi:hypothetical protein